MINVYHEKLPNKLQSLFSIGYKLRYETRQAKQFKVKYKRTNIKDFCISSVGIKLWNLLPSSVTEAKTLNH